MDQLTPLRQTIDASSVSYPRRLRDLSDAPVALHVAGELPGLECAVAMVGTRAADDEALDFAYGLAHDLAREGVVVVSGGAIGIDRAAHEGALDAGGCTLAVLPIGLDQPYPRANHDLFRRILGAGCLVTEVPDGAAIQKGRFLTRNRLVAALGECTVVVQAPTRSGALSTARHAHALGRPVFVTPASPWDPRGSGNLALLRKGARICVGRSDVLSGSAVGEGVDREHSSGGRDGQRRWINLSPSEKRVLEALESRAGHVDELCQKTGIPALEVQRTILSLRVRGLVEERPGGRFKSCRGRSESY